ncbi:MAG: HAMP domain-containing sensor histidine kinase [Tissierellia bacterium]|nr:HAMP domain-containing sensor histidine kinase [Tissierellia bacterium]
MTKKKWTDYSIAHIGLLLLLSVAMIGLPIFSVFTIPTETKITDLSEIRSSIYYLLHEFTTKEDGIHPEITFNPRINPTIYMRRVEIENLLETEEFKEKLRKNTNRFSYDIRETEELEKRDFKDDKGLENIKKVLSTLEEKGEEPKTKVITSYSLHVEDGYKLKNPEELPMEGNGYMIHGIIDHGNIKDINIKSKGLGDKYKDIEEFLKNDILDYFTFTLENPTDFLGNGQVEDEGGVFITPRDRIERVNFSIFFSEKDILNIHQYYNKFHLESSLQSRIPYFLFLGILILGFFILRENYESLTSSMFSKFIASIPFEIPIFCFLILFGSMGAFHGIGTWSIGLDGNNESFILWSRVFEGMIIEFFFFLFFYYVLIRIRDIFDHHWKKGLWEHSLLFHLTNGVKKVLSSDAILEREEGQTLYRQELTSDTLLRYILFCILHGCILFIILGFIDNRGLQLIFFLIYLGVLGFILWDIYKNIDIINRISYEIGKGNYGVKIPEDKSYFKTIVHNFNTISDNLDDAVSEAVKSERMKTELITNVSHDLKTPLTSILNYSDLLVHENDENKKSEYAMVIHEKSLKLKKLIEDLFEASKASSNNVKYEKEYLDFKALVTQMVGEWEDAFREKKLHLVLNLPKEDVPVYLDGTKTSRILENLFSNISKYTMENTRVYIDLKKTKERMYLYTKNISKDPLNISPEELMLRFTRGDGSRATEGSGLGLSIAESNAKGQGGQFSIDVDGDLFKTILEFPLKTI